MGEVHSILQRMRDLAVQASNTGSQDSDARTAAQTEFDQLQTEIDRVGNTTRFGSTKLLDGTLGAESSATGVVQTGPFTTGAAGVAQDFDIVLEDTGGNAHTVTVSLAALTAYSGQGFVDAVNAQITADEGVWANGETSTVHAQLLTGLSGSYQVKLAGSADFDVANVGADLTGVVHAAGSFAVAGAGGVFQVGANYSAAGDEKITIAIGDVRVAALGAGALTGVSAKIATGDASAIDNIDTAIKAISTARANLGAFQNRFEHTIANLNVTAENLSASESRIRDTDMAEEMVNFTRSQILTQAGTAMLAQANQAPQQVLQLLRG